MTRVTPYLVGFSALNSSRSLNYWYGLTLSAFLCGPVLAQDLAVPAVAASQPSLGANLMPLAAPAATQSPSASGVLNSPSVPAPAKPAAASHNRWKSLSAVQQRALAPLENDWSHLDTQQRLKWLEIASRFVSMPIEEQARLQERMSSWAKLSPVERNHARLMFLQAQQIAPESRQAKWDSYQALAPEQRQELAAKAAQRALATNASGGALQAKPGKHLAAGAKRTPADHAKSNVVPARTSAPLPKPVTPTLLQKKPGVTTMLINQAASPPAHQLSGLMKIVATPDLVDPQTLLPKRAAAAARTPEPAVATPPGQ